MNAHHEISHQNAKYHRHWFLGIARYIFMADKEGKVGKERNVKNI